MRVKNFIVEQTGGYVYVAWGVLEDGRYFSISSDCLFIYDEDEYQAMEDDNFDGYEWEMKHLLKSYSLFDEEYQDVLKQIWNRYDNKYKYEYDLFHPLITLEEIKRNKKKEQKLIKKIINHMEAIMENNHNKDYVIVSTSCLTHKYDIENEYLFTTLYNQDLTDCNCTNYEIFKNVYMFDLENLEDYDEYDLKIIENGLNTIFKNTSKYVNKKES